MWGLCTTVCVAVTQHITCMCAVTCVAVYTCTYRHNIVRPLCSHHAALHFKTMIHTYRQIEVRNRAGRRQSILNTFTRPDMATAIHVIRAHVHVHVNMYMYICVVLLFNYRCTRTYGHALGEGITTIKTRQRNSNTDVYAHAAFWTSAMC